MAEQRITIYGEERRPDRRDLRFHFKAEDVRTSCQERAEHHRDREGWWRSAHEQAQVDLRESMQLREHDVTGGKRVAAVFDEEKQARVSECSMKITEHERQADEYEAWVVGLSQMVGQSVPLSPDDIRFFGLAGTPVTTEEAVAA